MQDGMEDTADQPCLTRARGYEVGGTRAKDIIDWTRSKCQLICSDRCSLLDGEA